MARKQPPKKPIRIVDRIDPNAVNSINPLDELPYDINTLIPFSEFNWDTIAGMDDIHNDVMKSYSSLASQLADEVGKIEERVGIIDANVVNSLDRQTTMIADNVTAIDTKVLNTLEDATSCFQDEYGNCISELQWYIVNREIEGIGCQWVLEKASSPPLGRESYGPFKDCNPIMLGGPLLQQALPTRNRCNCQTDPMIQQKLNSMYAMNVDAIIGYSQGQWREGEDIIFSTGNRCVSPIVLTPGGMIQDCSIPTTSPDVNECAYWGVIGPDESQTGKCPPNIECDGIGFFPDGRAYYIEKLTGNLISYPKCDIRKPNIPEVYTPNDPNPPAKPPVDETPLPQPLPPNPNRGDNPTTVVCPNPVIVNPVVCPPTTVNNITNEAARESTLPNDFQELIAVLKECCETLKGNREGSKAEATGSDFQYLFADDSIKRMDSFFAKNDLMEYADNFPKDISKAIKTSLLKVNRLEGLND